MEEQPIRRGSWEDEERIGALLSVSFTSDPFVRWIMPNSLHFLRDSMRHPRRAYAPAFEAGTIFIFDDFWGAALWVPPGVKADRTEEISQADPDKTSEDRLFPRSFPNCSGKARLTALPNLIGI